MTDPADPLKVARDLMLAPGGLDDRRLDRVFGEVLSHSVDFADLYFQHSQQESWSLEDGIVKDGSASIEQGVGVRALAGEKTGFAYSDEIVLPALEEASHAARAIAVHGGQRTRAAHGARNAAMRSTCRRTRWPRSPPPTRSRGSSASTARRGASIRASCRSWPASSRCTRWS